MNAKAMPKTVDTHVHLLDHKKFHYDWVEEFGLHFLNRDYLPAEYEQDAKTVNIVKAIYMEADTRPSENEKEAQMVIELCERDDNIFTAAILSLDFLHDDLESQLQRFANIDCVTGFRYPLAVSNASEILQAPKFIENTKLLGQYQLNMDLCFFPEAIEAAVALIEQCPDTQFIIDHCGFIPGMEKEKPEIKAWHQQLQAVANKANVACKLSGTFSWLDKEWQVADVKPVVDCMIDYFGETNVMYASNWPVDLSNSTPSSWAKALYEAVSDRSDEVIANIFYENAVRIYNLD